MLAIFISWIAISIVFLSLGDLFIFLYNKFCKGEESYGITDTFLLGMCFTLFPLSFSSLWLPSNHYVMFFFLIFSVVYWMLRRKHLCILLRDYKDYFTNFSFYHYILIAIPIVSLMVAILWQVGVFDSLFYHQQNIRWNEQYAVVPGLGNLEDRFGFNSNYLLLSALFSFRFLFGEAVYGLHVLVLVYVLCWILTEIIKSGYEIRRIVLLVVFTGYIFIFGYTLTATSTDAIPNILSFYLIAKLLLYPNSVKNKQLFWIIVPITLLTFKVTILPLVLVSLYVAYLYIRDHKFDNLLFVVIVSFFIVGLWLVRNVIITGYLIYPLSQIDLFSVDWKMPQYVAFEQRDFITSCGQRVLRQEVIPNLLTIPTSVSALNAWLTSFIFIGGPILSIFILVYAFFKKRFLDKLVYLSYAILLGIFMIWLFGAPDPRFIGGTLFAFSYFSLFILLSTPQAKTYKYIGFSVVFLFSSLMGYWAITRTITYCDQFNILAQKPNVRTAKEALIKQYPYRESLKSAKMYVDKFEPYQMNDSITIYMSYSTEVPNGIFVCFDDPFPGSAYIKDGAVKYLDVTDIEPKGTTLQDGFRPKKMDF